MVWALLMALPHFRSACKYSDGLFSTWIIDELNVVRIQTIYSFKLLY
jgi:hypothetical protein